MTNIAEALEKFKQLTDALRKQIHQFLEPFAAVLPDQRHRATLRLLVPSMLAGRSPQLSKAAAHAPDQPASPWALTKRFYTLLHTEQFSHQAWLAVLYSQAQQQVNALPQNGRLLVATDPMNLEKAYARKTEGICQVLKKTPPGQAPQQKRQRKSRGRITWGYPSMFTLALNTPQPALLHQRLFSYVTDDFISQPWEWIETMRHLRQLLPQRKVCMIADSEADDQKLWLEAQQNQLEFVVRATKKRNVAVWNRRKRRWQVQDLLSRAKGCPGRGRLVKAFTHAGRSVPIRVTLDWFRFRLPDGSWEGWAVVAQTEVIGPERPQDMWLPPRYIVLVTNRPVRKIKQAQQVYRDWSQRGQIELFYRFLQEDALDLEKILLHKLEQFRRMLLVVVMAAFFVLELEQVWSPVLLQWIRSLVSSVVGTAMDRRGHYLLLRGLQQVLAGQALLEHIRIRPPPIGYLPPPR